MLQFLEAGLVTASRQLVAVVVVTVATILLAPNKIAVHEGSVTGSDAGYPDGSVSPLLPWTYLLTATGLILIRSRSVIMTAERIRSTSRLVGPERDLKMFVAQLGLSAVIFAIFALRPAPEPLIEIAHYFGYTGVATIVWAGSMTVAIAGLGATAHAAARAL